MSARPLRGFTLVELLVVVGIVAALIGVLLPSLNTARRSAVRTQCLSNVRQLCIAQAGYAAEQRNLLVYAGDGTEQGGWIGVLQSYVKTPLQRRCPADASVYFDQSTTAPPLDPKFRTTSYGINNFVSPTHGPSGLIKPKRITQVPRSSRVVQFAELAEAGSYAVADHLHVHQWFVAATPDDATTLATIGTQMPLGRHGGLVRSWRAVLNYGFVDGHAESLRLEEVYRSPERNRFDFRVAN